MPEIDRGQTWAIILAGGDGTRLASLTHALHREPTPKQFASIDGEQSMLQATILRTARMVPFERIVVVVGPTHARWARPQLAPFPDVALLVQPESLGTAPAILYGLAAIRGFDPDADILILPSDHHVANPGALVAALEEARAAARELDRVVLLGVRPELPDADYGWIVAGSPIAQNVRALDRFVEKPDQETAGELFRAAGLWNTFIMCAPVRTLDRLARATLPLHAARFADLAAREVDISDAFRDLPAADFSRDVLQLARKLAVVPLIGAGWSDWGTPARVLSTLRGTLAEQRLRACMIAP